MNHADLLKRYRSVHKKKRVYKAEYNEEGEQIYCHCRGVDDGEFMVSCDICQEWFHGSCVSVNEEDEVDVFLCKQCEKEALDLREEKKQDAIRAMARKNFFDAISAVFKQGLDNGLDICDVDPKTYATTLEQSMFDLFNQDNECKDKVLYLI
jgi:hypothetical protein